MSRRSKKRTASHIATPQARPERRYGRSTTAWILAALALVFIFETTYSYTQKSATWDEPIHILDGYASVVRGDFRFDTNHPPFLRMFAALPLVFGTPLALDTTVIDRTSPDLWEADGLFTYTHQFMYVDNDADSLLYRSRFMIVLLGLLLGFLVFFWADEWFGRSVAFVAVAMLFFEPNIVSHFSLVTTDGAVTTFVFGAVFFLWRVTRRATPWNIGGLTLFASLAIVTKFTAVLLFPALFLLLVSAVFLGKNLGASRTAIVGMAVVAGCWLSIWAIYGFRYDPSSTPNWLFDFDASDFAKQRVPVMSDVIGWIDDHHLFPNVFSQGFLIGQAKAQLRDTYLAGAYSKTGWWYFFPVAILIKTPLSFLALAAVGAIVLIRKQAWREGHALFMLVPILCFLVPAMASNINIGLRHVLVIYPFAVMLAAAAVREILRRYPSSSRGVLLALGIFWGVEFGRAYPHTLAFFNTLVGGPAHGVEYLVDSNLDWGQDLKPLKQWMDDNRVPSINLAYFGSADPAYYGIRSTYINGTAGFIPQTVELPRLPGYVAVSATLLTGTYTDGDIRHREFYKPLLVRTPTASIGHSINVYWVERPWW